MRCVVLIALLGLGACHTAKAPVVATTQSRAEFARTRPDTFIAGYNQVLDADRRRVVQHGLEKDLAAVRAVVDFHLPPGNYTLQATNADPHARRPNLLYRRHNGHEHRRYGNDPARPLHTLFVARQNQPRDDPAPASHLYGRVFGPLRSFAGKFSPVGESSHPEATFNELRAAIAEQRAGDPTVRITPGVGR